MSSATGSSMEWSTKTTVAPATPPGRLSVCEKVVPSTGNGSANVKAAPAASTAPQLPTVL